jgi:hypothetical protein
MTAFIEPKFFLADPQIRPFVIDERVDLTAPNVPIAATGKYVVSELRPPRGQVYLIKNITPYAMARTNVGLATESFQFLNPIAAGGFFSFEPTVNDNAPFIIEQNYNSPKIAGAASLNNNDRIRAKGIGYITDAPWVVAQNGWFNPLFTVLVPSNAVFRLIFSILPVSATDPLPAGGQFGVGGAGGTRRVDFAGSVLVGQQMSEQYYHGLAQRVAAQP